MERYPLPIDRQSLIQRLRLQDYKPPKYPPPEPPAPPKPPKPQP